MKLKKIIIIALLIIFIISIYIFFKKITHEEKNNTFRIGTSADYAPWVSVSEQGEYEGFDIDVINEVAKKINKKLIIQDLGSMSALFLALEQGKIDVIIWGISITQDRLKQLAMVRYQGDTITSFPLIFWQKIPTNIKSINDMKDMTVCVEPSSSQDTVLSKYDFINKKFTEKVDDALLNIQYGKADAALVEPAIAKKFKNKYPEIQMLDVPLAIENQVYGVGICIKKNNTELINQIQQAINDLNKEGFIKKFESKWDI